MLDVSAEPQDGFLESDFDVHVQVISHSLEIAVGLHDQAEDEVPRQVVRMLLTFPLKYDFLPVFHPGFHHDRIVLRFLDHLLSLTNWAVIGTHFPLPLTNRASRLHLHIEADRHLHGLHDGSLTLAFLACLGYTVLIARAFAVWANYIFRQRNLPLRTLIQLFESNLNIGSVVIASA